MNIQLNGMTLVFAFGEKKMDTAAKIAALPEAIFKTLTEKIAGKFPRPAEIDRQHARILFARGLIERSKLFAMADGAGLHWVLVPTLACKQALDEMENNKHFMAGLQ